MQNFYKTFIISALSTLLFFCSSVCFAQYPGMAAFRAQQNTQFINQQMRMQFQMMNMHGVQATDQEYEFIVTFRDSSKKEITSAIYTDSLSKKRFLIFVDKKYKKSDTNRYKKIYPSQTLNLHCISNYYRSNSKESLQGKPADSCWVFKAIKGYLNVYSYQVTDGASDFPSSLIIGIQLNDGPVLPFNKENLKSMVGQNARVLELIEDKKYVSAIKWFNRNKEKDSGK